MSLLDEAQASTKQVGGTCGVTLLVRRLSPEEQAELREALDSTVESSALSRALARRDIRMPAQTIARHRRRECSCP